MLAILPRGTSKKMLITKMLANFPKMLTIKNVANIFKKMLTKNVGYTLKNVDKKC
jgi:hypothetical protein